MNNTGCIFLEEGINFDCNKVMDCCISHNDGRGLPLLFEDYNGESINWDILFKKKEERIKKQKEETIYECEGCYHLSEYEFKGIKKISEFHFSHCRICNAKCIYCSDEHNSGEQNYSTYPIIKDLIDKGFYKSGGEATFQGGEPLLMKDFENLIELFNKYGTKIRVHSNGIKYSQAVADAIKNNDGHIVISIDSGTSTTYKKIKQVNSFNFVCENIKKYIDSAGDNNENIIIKYVIVPGYNDSIREVNKFFELMQQFKIRNIAVDIEVTYARKNNNKDISNHIYILYDYFILKAAQCKIKLLTYSFITYVLRNRNFKQTPCLFNSFFYSLYLNFHKDRRKFVNYKK